MSTISTYSRSLFMLGFQKQMVCFFSFHSDRVCISCKILECCLHELDINILPQKLIQRVPSSRTSVKCQKNWVLFFKANCRLNQVRSPRKHKTAACLVLHIRNCVYSQEQTLHHWSFLCGDQQVVMKTL